MACLEIFGKRRAFASPDLPCDFLKFDNRSALAGMTRTLTIAKAKIIVR